MHSLTTGTRPAILLTLLSALLFLPGLASIPPTDRDEARFMQATKQMLETGDLVNIRFQDEARTKKPVGIHWLQYLSVKFGADADTLAVWAYRLPSALAAWLTILSIFYLGRRHFDARIGLFAATLTASTFILIVEAHLAKTDAVLLLSIVLAHAALLEFYKNSPAQPPPLQAALLFWAAVGLGILIKGPVICAILIATVAALGIADRNLRWLHGLRPLIGLPTAFAFILPWFLALTASGNADVLTTSLTEDFIPKLFSGAEGHGALPGTHLLLAPVTLWPASLFLLPGLILAWQRRTDPVLRFVLAWASATWVMFELVPTKLPHYILPAVPALALAVAASWTPQTLPPARWSVAIWSLIAALVGGVLVWAALTYNGNLAPAALLAMSLLAAVAVVMSRKVSSVLIVPTVACLLALLVFSGVLPRLSDLALSKRLATSIDEHSEERYIPVALSRYHEPSAVFLIGTNTVLTNARNSAAHISADPSALAVVAPDQLSSVIEMVQAQMGRVIVLDRINGFNYSKGRPEALILIRSEPVETTP